MAAIPRWLVYVGAAAFALVGTGVVLAESAVPEVPDAPEIEQAAELSAAQQTSWAENELSQMEQLSERIQGLLDQARRERDIIKVTCLNDKLTQINVSIRSFQQRMEQHAEAIRGRNDEQRNHAYRLMVILAQRARTLRIEAEGCVGETDVIFGRTRVETEIDPSITPDDPSEIPEVDFVFERPPSASGYY
jgi:hypothetical protein